MFKIKACNKACIYLASKWCGRGRAGQRSYYLPREFSIRGLRAFKCAYCIIALLCAKQMLVELKKLNALQEKNGEPALRIGIGIHTGDAAIDEYW